MNKTLFKFTAISCVWACSATAYAQSNASVTLYGNIDTSLQILTNAGQKNGKDYVRDAQGHVVTSTKLSLESSKRQSSSWGLRGKEDLGGGLRAFFDLGAGFKSDDGTPAHEGRLFGRYAYVGLEHVDYGKLSFGRQYTAMLEHYSMFEPYGVPGAGIVATHTTKYTDGVRVDNAVAYKWNKNGFYTTVVLGMGEKAGSIVEDSTASIGLGYGNEDFKIGIAHLGHRNKCYGAAADCAKGKNINTPRAYTIAGYYNFTPTITGYLGYLENSFSRSFYEARAKPKDSMLWGGVKARLDNWILIGAIYHDRTRHANVTPVSEPTIVYESGRVTTYSLSAEYRLSKRTGIYTQVDLTRAKDALRFGNGLSARSLTDEQATQTALNIGMRHSF